MGAPNPLLRPDASGASAPAGDRAETRNPTDGQARGVRCAARAKFARSKIDADKFQVHVQGGVATIEGRTDITQHKGVATRLAKTGGALAVNNHIQVSDAAKEKAAANLEKGRRRVQIKRGDARSDSSQPNQSR